MASFSTLLTPIIESIILQEIGEANIAPLNWKRVSTYRYKFLVDINDFTEVVTVDFDQITDKEHREIFFPPKYRNLYNIFNVGYHISGVEKQFAKTDLKTLLSILSTVVDIIKDFLKTQSLLDGLYIQATEINTGEMKKTNLYKAYIKKQLEQLPGFSVDTYRNGFIIIKTK